VTPITSDRDESRPGEGSATGHPGGLASTPRTASHRHLKTKEHRHLSVKATGTLLARESKRQVVTCRLLVPSKEPLLRRRSRVLASSLRLENCESLFARITNSMEGANDADACGHDYEDEDNEQPEGIHVFILSGVPACAGR
jgi:hypothetical protein